MKVLDKLIAFMSISITTAVMGQLPFFLQRFRPKNGLLGSASSYSSLFSPLPSASFMSPSYSSATSLFGSSPSNYGSSFGSLGLGSSPLPSTSFGSLGLSSSPFSSTSFGSLSLGSSPLSSTSFGSPSFGSPSFGPPSFGSPSLGSHFASSNFGSSFAPPGGPSSFSSSGLGIPHGFSSSSSFGSANLGHSPFSSASFNSPTVGLRPPKFDTSFAASTLPDFSSSNNFDGLGELDPIDLIEDYPGFSTTGFGKDLNFAASQPVKYQSPPLGNKINFQKRSVDKE